MQNGAPIIFKWHRVSKKTPCAVCKKPDFCTFTLDGKNDGGSCCMREISQKPLKNGGHWFPFNEPLPPDDRRRHVAMQAKPTEPVPDFGAMMSKWRGEGNPDRWNDMAESLGLPWSALWWLSPVWAQDRRAMAFPMFAGADASEHKPCGIRLRTPDGNKFAVTGSKSGLFIPHRAIRATVEVFDLSRIFVCEGPSDTAACLHLGLFAIGRASCRGGEEAVAGVCSKYAKEVVIVSDNDGPGAAGADLLASKIRQPHYRLCTPAKDLRAFIGAGGSRAVLESILLDLKRICPK